MILALDPDDKSLDVFLTEGDAISACEGTDLEELLIEFWINEGKSLKAGISLVIWNIIEAFY